MPCLSTAWSATSPAPDVASTLASSERSTPSLRHGWTPLTRARRAARREPARAAPCRPPRDRACGRGRSARAERPRCHVARCRRRRRVPPSSLNGHAAPRERAPRPSPCRSERRTSRARARASTTPARAGCRSMTTPFVASSKVPASASSAFTSRPRCFPSKAASSVIEPPSIFAVENESTCACSVAGRAVRGRERRRRSARDVRRAPTSRPARDDRDAPEIDRRAHRPSCGPRSRRARSRRGSARRGP